MNNFEAKVLIQSTLSTILRINEAKIVAKMMLALVDDFQTSEWIKSVPYPELVYQKTTDYLQQS